VYCQNPRVAKIIQSKQPMKTHGHITLPSDRILVWRNLCMIGPNFIECVVEMSKKDTRFYILALDLFSDKFHIIELYTQQAKKLAQACDGHLDRIMKLLDFKSGRFFIKHYDLLMSYERYMPEQAKHNASISMEMK